MIGHSELTEEIREKICSALAKIKTVRWIDFTDVQSAFASRGDPLASQEMSYLKTPIVLKRPKNLNLVNNKESQPIALNFNEREGIKKENIENDKPTNVEKIDKVQEIVKSADFPKTALSTPGPYEPIKEAARRRSANIKVEQAKHVVKKAAVTSSLLRPEVTKTEALKTAPRPVLRAPIRSRSGCITRFGPSRSTSSTHGLVENTTSSSTASNRIAGPLTAATRTFRSASSGPSRSAATSTISTNQLNQPNTPVSLTTRIGTRPGSMGSALNSRQTTSSRGQPVALRSTPQFMKSGNTAQPVHRIPRIPFNGQTAPRRASPPQSNIRNASRPGSITSLSSSSSTFKTSCSKKSKPASQPSSLRDNPPIRPQPNLPIRSSSRGPVVPCSQVTVPVTPKFATSSRLRSFHSTPCSESKHEPEVTNRCPKPRPTVAQLQATFNRLSKPKKR